ncbi:hypothetical protein EZS27_003907 [termite gut metagenome]|uniref:Uncharacterized protein n=1 Tax=termite gut metagenome TaxID=433724 RepID=A0A5J4SR80_9ZZZZ
MKALSEKQPFGYLICAGIKDIENRTWKTNFRGRVLIHASAKGEYAPLVLNKEQMLAVTKKGVWSNITYYKTSAIIGSVEIVDCLQNHPSIWAEKSYIREHADYEPGTYIQKVYNWVLKNPVLFEKPVLNIKGKLSFWESGYNEDEIIRQIGTRS